MSIQLMSDLHLESPQGYDIFEIQPQAPCLALLGDIGNVVKHRSEYLGFLKTQLKQFRIVMLVAGNHEAYHSSWEETLETLHRFEDEVGRDESLGDFVFLNRRRYRIPNSSIIVLGCSLFSQIPSERAQDVSMGLNDFFQTDDWDTDLHNKNHKRDLEWLNGELTQIKDPTKSTQIYIFTHWSPTMDPRASDPRHGSSRISSAFSTDLSEESCFQDDRVKLWAFGHTHYNCDLTIARRGRSALRLLANQRGYYFAQAEGFDMSLIVTSDQV